MSHQIDRPAIHASAPTDDVVRAACLLARHHDIASVHVVASRRPSYEDILRARQFASRRGLHLAVGASEIAFRRVGGQAEPDAMPAVSRVPNRPPADDRRRLASPGHPAVSQSAATHHGVPMLLDWLRARVRVWQDTSMERSG